MLLESAREKIIFDFTKSVADFIGTCCLSRGYLAPTTIEGQNKKNNKDKESNTEQNEEQNEILKEKQVIISFITIFPLIVHFTS